MRVISQRTLREFWQRNPDAEEPLRHWYKTASAAVWTNIHDVRQSFAHADGVPLGGRDTLTVFNICGNDYRLVVRIRYDYQLINVRWVLTHAEYDRNQWKD